jgi:hypothetical protein
LIGGGSDVEETSNRLGLPLDLVKESESFRDVEGGIYPDNVQAVRLFYDMLTQWRVGVGGSTGLDYTALPVVMGIRKIKRKDRESLFESMQVMEHAALKSIKESSSTN